MTRPNLFQIATKELSQDAFLTWMLQWADPAQRDNDPALNECARQFVVLLLKEQADFEVTSIVVGRQWNNVDVWAEINGDTLLIIEDKKHAGQHGDQLETYRAMAGAWCEEPERGRPWRLVCVYLKTGNEAAGELAAIQEKGYDTVGRAALVALFGQHQRITNAIFLDFLAYLNALDEAAAGYLNKPWNHWHNGDWEGFYLWLDTQPDVRKHKWFWVDNPSGGFWAFLLNWGHEHNDHPLYVQIESDRKSLCIKMSTEEGGPQVQPDGYRSYVRQEYHDYVMRKAAEAGLVHVRKPARFGTGAYMTVAVIPPEHWLGAPDQPVDFELVKQKLNSYTAFTDDCAKSWPEPTPVAE